ncbi:MAG: AAA family ATPase [Desulfobacteraceae bacterium]|jgi:general secretion pathway protein A
MYLSHYGLNEKPFDISTDPKFLWLGEKHKEAFAVLKYGVMENKGFLLLTGDIGAGKTTLINALINSVSEEVIYAFVPDPGLELMDFYRYLSNAFYCDHSFTNKADFIFMFRDFLLNAHESGKKVLLIIDEAQRLSNELLEEIRLLSNIELQDSKLLNIFFVGQAEFNTKLLEPENRSVRQRITISNHIQPLTEKETGDYIRHRLKVAGSQKNIFSYVAIHEVYNFSAGYPRLINIVCDISLLTGYVRDKIKISDDIVRESIESLNIEPHTTPSKRQEIRKHLESSLRIEKDAHIPSVKADTSFVVGKKSKNNRAWFYIIIFMILVSIGAIITLYFKGWEIRRFISEFQFIQSAKSRLVELITDVKVDRVEVGDVQKKQRMVLPYVETVDDGDGTNSNGNMSGVSGVDAIQEKEADNVATASNTFNDSIVLDFNRNSNEFSDQSYKTLSELAVYLINNPRAFVLVVGYTDNFGTYSYNVNLSSFRANTVKSYLVGKGIDKKRIKATGLGPDNPISSNDTEMGREKNRRVEIEILKK